MKLAHRMATLVLLLFAFSVRAAEVHVAVAANFIAPMQAIAADFAHDTEHRAIVTGGATGSLYAQIRNGAPFEVFLSADQKTPERLESEGFVVPGQRFTYAVGKLVLFSATPGLVDAKGAILMDGRFTHLAIANPKTAPYGAAGYETLKAMGLLDAVQAKIVQGENIGQTFEFVSSGNAELGFVALSQAAAPGKPAKGSWWLVPAQLYSPLRQDGVLLKTGAGSDAAKALVDYLRSEKAKAVIRSYGYDL